MNDVSSSQNRKTRRSNVLMSASLELSGTSVPVKLRNLSEDGALVEGDGLPVEGASVQFRKGDLSVPGRVAWVNGKQAGVSFAQNLNTEQVMRHIPAPRARVAPDFRRPGFKGTLTANERRFGETWVWRFPPATD